jgi:hypothetical protein
VTTTGETPREAEPDDEEEHAQSFGSIKDANPLNSSTVDVELARRFLSRVVGNHEGANLDLVARNSSALSTGGTASLSIWH